MNEQLPQQLAERLTQPLPGRIAHAQMAPDLSYGRQFVPPPADVRQAAVILLLYPRQGMWHLPLTLRPAHLADHAGQISFPGGRVEPLDTSLRDTALREAAEEIGMRSEYVEVVGYLPPHAVVTGFVITPVVGIVNGEPTLVADSSEVAEIFEAPLSFFLDPANRLDGQRSWHGVSFAVPEFQVGEHRVWGATAQIISTLIQIIDN